MRSFCTSGPRTELLPHFITSRLARGGAGWLLAAVLAASMCSVGAGIHSICTLLIVDFHRRLGIGRHFLARRLNKPVDQLSEADELRVGRLLVLIIGITVTFVVPRHGLDGRHIRDWSSMS